LFYIQYYTVKTRIRDDFVRANFFYNMGEKDGRGSPGCHSPCGSLPTLCTLEIRPQHFEMSAHIQIDRQTDVIVRNSSLVEDNAIRSALRCQVPTSHGHNSCSQLILLDVKTTVPFHLRQKGHMYSLTTAA